MKIDYIYQGENMFTNLVYLTAFLLIDFWEQPYLWNALFGFSALLGSFLVALIVAICLFFILRFIFKKRLSYSLKVTLSLTITISSSLGVLAFLIWIFYQLPTYINWKYYGLSLIIHPLIPLLFFLFSLLGFFSWYRYLRKHKVIIEDSSADFLKK